HRELVVSRLSGGREPAPPRELEIEAPLEDVVGLPEQRGAAGTSPGGRALRALGVAQVRFARAELVDAKRESDRPDVAGSKVERASRPEPEEVVLVCRQ